VSIEVQLEAVPEADADLKERIFLKKFAAYSAYPGMFALELGGSGAGFPQSEGARPRTAGDSEYKELLYYCYRMVENFYFRDIFACLVHFVLHY